MRLLIPMDGENVQEAEITKINDAKIWAQVVVEEGEVVEILHNDNWENFEAMSEYVIVKDDNEYVWPFIEYNMLVLVAHMQRTIDDIVEAYLFKELHELAY